MKMFDQIIHYRKDGIYETYTRIVDKFKDYEKISKSKMLEAIYKVYSDYNNIIEICTTKELKYLKMILDKGKNSKKDINLNDVKYSWERGELITKFLLIYDYHSNSCYIPEEIINNIQDALKNVNWKTQKNMDNLNEILVGYFETQGSALLHPTSTIISSITGINSAEIVKHMLYNKLFNYYVFLTTKYYNSLGEVTLGICQRFYALLDELDEERRKQGLAGEITVDIEEYRTLFYYNFNINKPIIKKFITELKKLPFFYDDALNLIREYSLLNKERDSLKEEIASVPVLKNYDLTEIFNLMDKAMDEMPSGALNGFTPNEAKKIITDEIISQKKRQEKYVKQKEAHISKKDAKLFYKIYFDLLDFTNKKYKIKPKLIINPIIGVNPNDIIDIVEKFWNNKETIVLEFCLGNSKKYTKEELKIAERFKDGIRDMFVIIKYEKEYTALMSMNTKKVYMIKGLNDNIDNTISNSNLPYLVQTTIIPFKNILTYDGLLSSPQIKIGNNIHKSIEREYDKAIKNYHL